MADTKPDYIMAGDSSFSRGGSLPSLSAAVDRATFGYQEWPIANGSTVSLTPNKNWSTNSLDNPMFANDIEASGSFQRRKESTANGLNRSISTSTVETTIDTGSQTTLRKSMASTVTLTLNEEELDEYGEVIISDEKLKMMRKIHHIIIDCTPINYIDTSGCNVLSHIYTEYGHVGIKVFLAGFSSDMRRSLQARWRLRQDPTGQLLLPARGRCGCGQETQGGVSLPKELGGLL
ncbi:hypothetical protein C0Q70_05136 [Pomacea canaliculata]|uniref:STAS domain-containing protein n=1 Tax=Pomacea canaliculata TaxID=400727 RepID=A0A2T7PKE7_POMCA|nr:hypothetical protein C0Q70_05136 [Pomacea canaliculata]